jgi:hypothetical protein
MVTKTFRKKLIQALQDMLSGGVIWTLLLFILIFRICFYKGFRFQYPNFIFTYPLISYDGYQWISDGLHYLDRNIEAIHRNPALPLIFAFLRSYELTDFFPILMGLLTFAFYVSAYFLARAFFSPGICRLVVLWFFFVFRIHNFFDYVLSDPWCLVLMTTGLGCLVRVEKEPKMLLGAAVSFGLAMNFQFAPAFAAPALFWFLFNGIGIKTLKLNKAMSVCSVAVFLLLVLPQFVYKWIAFGSPLYSHVTQFPLIRVHLFGIPFYAINFFAFLGWPLALTVMYGFKKAFNSRQAEWELMHAYSLCMFFFWVICYLWLDVRFLLYLIPGWIVYAGKGIESLDLLRRLSFRGKTILQRVAILVAIYFGASMAAVRMPAFESTVLPLTPQLNVRFSSKPISEWGVSTLTIDRLTTEHFDTYETLFNFSDYYEFYRQLAKAPRGQSNEFVRDVLILAQKIAETSSSKDRIGLCEDLESVFEIKMKIHFTIARNFGKCDLKNKFWIARNKTIDKLLKENPSYAVTWRGDELSLMISNQLTSDP